MGVEGEEEKNEEKEEEEEEDERRKRRKMSAINANEDIQIAIDSMAGNFQERFEAFVSALKSSVSSSSRAQAEKVFLSAIPALSYKFPDPT
ncbi:hypothetical protein PoB_000302400, partial [Plakobranchus ocellatus]